MWERERQEEEEEEEEEEGRDLLGAEVARRLVERNAAHGSVGFPTNGKTMEGAPLDTGAPRRDESSYSPTLPKHQRNTRHARRCLDRIFSFSQASG